MTIFSKDPYLGDFNLWQFDIKNNHGMQTGLVWLVSSYVEHNQAMFYFGCENI